MGTLADVQVVDNVTDVLAAFHNALLGSSIRGEWSNATTMSGTVALQDVDYPIQRFNCNGANRIVTLPVQAAANHPFVICNVTAATYTLDVQTSGGVTLLSSLLVAVKGMALIVPDGSAGFRLAGTDVATLKNYLDGLYSGESDVLVVQAFT